MLPTYQSNMSVHHYRRVALCFVNVHQKGRFWAASLASGSSMPNKDRSLQTFQIQVERGLPGGAWPPWGSSPVIWQLHKQNSTGVSQLIHSSDMSKQRESTGLDNRGKWRLLSHSTYCIIPDEVMPANIWDPSKAPLIRCIYSLHICILDCPAKTIKVSSCMSKLKEAKDGTFFETRHISFIIHIWSSPQRLIECTVSWCCGWGQPE